MMEQGGEELQRREPNRNLLLLCLVLLSCISVALMLFFSFKAGCAANLKSGTGDIFLSLRLEGYAVFFLWMSTILNVITAYGISRSRYWRVLYIMVVAVLSLFTLYLGVIWAGEWGMQTCHP